MKLHRLCTACLLLAGCYEPPNLGGTEESTGDTVDPTVTTSGDPSTSPTSPTSTVSATTNPDTMSTTDETDSSVTDPSTGETTPGSSGEESSSGTTGPADSDGDGVDDPDDNCPNVENADQSDIDTDEVGDWCDTEVIDDGDRIYIPTGEEYELFGPRCITGEARIYGTARVPPYDPDVIYTGALILVTPARIWVAEGGVIDATGTGYRGGAPSATADRGGWGGDGTSPGCGGGPGQSVGQGGSGGGYGGSGGVTSLVSGFTEPCDVCGEPTVAHCVGAPGAAFGTQSGEDVSFGSGGGAAGNSSGCTNAGGRGGHGGGGILLISDDTVRVDGRVVVDGEKPPEDGSTCGYRAGGGGGSGGAIAFAAPTIEGAATGLLSSRGGEGGNALGDTVASEWGWAGGGGGGGRIKLYGNSDDWAGATDVTGGAGGTAPANAFCYPGEPGGDGSVGTAAMIPTIFADFECPP